jgi:hypothetical protein
MPGLLVVWDSEIAIKVAVPESPLIVKKLIINEDIDF